MRIIVHIKPKQGVLNPENKIVEDCLHSLNFNNISNVLVGKIIEFDVIAKDKQEAHNLAIKTCEKFLVNKMIEEYSIEVTK